MSLYQTDNGRWVIGSGGCWLPGSYATKEAARYAFQFPDKVLVEVRDRCLPNAITTEDLRKAARERGVEGVSREADGAQKRLTEPASILALLKMLETDGEIGQCPRCSGNPTPEKPTGYHSKRCELRSTIDALEAHAAATTHKTVTEVGRNPGPGTEKEEKTDK